MRKSRYLATAAIALASLAVLVAQPLNATASRGSVAASCTPATNIAVIIDDSGSMTVTDPNKLRVSGIKLLLNKPDNAKKTMSALQFGGTLFGDPSNDATAVFAPGLIGQQKAAMAAALDAQINGDNGVTNYNAAFALRKTQNPNANRIIFLTDGGHNVGDYANGHQGGPPVDVVGFSSGITSEGAARLTQIANETGGTYHADTDSGNLQSIMNDIDATENCQQAPTKFLDQFTTVGQQTSHSLAIGSSTRAVDLTLSWGDPNNAFIVSQLKIVNHGQTVAQGQISKRKKKKKTKLKIRKSATATFETLHITKLKKGKLKFKLKATKLLAPGTPVNLTSQVSQGH